MNLRLLLTPLCILFVHFAQAQLTAWEYRRPVKIYSTSDTAQSNHQVLMVLNTQELVGEGKMQASGNDIRVSTDCDGANLVPHFLDGAANNTATKVWVQMATLAPRDSAILYFWYGNAAAAGASDFDAVFPPARRIVIGADETFADSVVYHNTFDWVEISSGVAARLPLAERVKITAKKVLISGRIDGVNRGEVGGLADNGQGITGGGLGPCGGSPQTGVNGNGGGGGGYGGPGGNGGGGVAGGGICGDGVSNNIQLGSGGGAGQITDGGNGGGAVILAAADLVVNGVVEMIGGEGAADNAGTTFQGGGGGGSGGGVLMRGNYISVGGGQINVTGGAGGDASGGGGGGGGGRIKLFHRFGVVPGTFTMNGGNGPAMGVNGGVGTYTETQSNNFNAEPFSVVLDEFAIRTERNSKVLCATTLDSLVLPEGFNLYNIYKNNNLVSAQTDNVYNDPNLVHGDFLYALMDLTGSPCLFATDTTDYEIYALHGDISADTVACQHELVNFSIDGFQGNLQWQDSVDGRAWANTQAPNLGAISFVLDSTTFLRAVVSENICSDTTNMISAIMQPVHRDTTFDTLCQGDTVFYGGMPYTMTGSFIDTLVNAFNCDSILNINITVNPVFDIRDTVTICEGDTAFFRDTFAIVEGNYVDSFSTIDGCDSVEQTFVFVNPKVFDTTLVTICNGDSFFAEGAFQTTTGLYNDTFDNVNGCDSIHTIDLTVVDSLSSRDTVYYCENDSVEVLGVFYSSDNFVRDTNVAAAGCDSFSNIVILERLHIRDTFQITICDDSSYFAGGAFQDTSGSYRDTFAASHGCDSIVLTELTVVPVFRDTNQLSICEGDSIEAGGQFVFTGGLYSDTFVSVVTGCDSIVFDSVSLFPIIRDTLVTTICEGDSFFAAGAFQDTSGIYIDTFAGAAQNGCDSIYVVDLTLLFFERDTILATICEGDTFTANGMDYQSAGVFEDTFALGGNNGCDSIAVYDITVLPLARDTQVLILCERDSFFAGGASQNADGIYSDTFANAAANGCDSIAYYDITFVSIVADTGSLTICEGDSVFAGGEFQTTSGVYTDTFIGVTASGCDSSFTLELTVTPRSVANVSVELCFGESIVINGVERRETGVYNDTLDDFAVSGCDSVIIYDVLVKPLPTFNQAFEICFGESVTVLNSTYTATGVYTDTIANAGANGCDSLIVTDLTVHELPIPNILGDEILCFGESTILQPADQTYVSHLWSTGDTTQSITADSSGVYVLSVVNTDGCVDSGSFELIVGQDLEFLIDPAELIVEEGQSISARVTPRHRHASVQWTPSIGLDCDDCFRVSASPSQTTDYTITLTEDITGCVSTQQVTIHVVSDINEVLTPNSFSPNGDGVNDVFRLYGGAGKEVSYTVYDRWGGEIFRSTGIDLTWDGRMRGEELNAGVYTVVIETRDNQGNLLERKQQFVRLLK